MDLKRRLSVKAQLPLKKKQNSKTFPLTWNQKNNNRVGINNKFVLNSFKVPAGVGNRYLTGCVSWESWWSAFVALCQTWEFTVLMYCFSYFAVLVTSYGYSYFFFDFLRDVWGWWGVEPHTAVEAFQSKPEGGYNKTLGPLTPPQPALLAEDLPPSKEDVSNPDSPKTRNWYSDVVLTGIYSGVLVFNVYKCVEALMVIFKG
jgi:hypothetical protein